MATYEPPMLRAKREPRLRLPSLLTPSILRSKRCNDPAPLLRGGTPKQAASERGACMSAYAETTHTRGCTGGRGGVMVYVTGDCGPAPWSSPGDVTTTSSGAAAAVDPAPAPAPTPAAAAAAPLDATSCDATDGSVAGSVVAVDAPCRIGFTVRSSAMVLVNGSLWSFEVNNTRCRPYKNNFKKKGTLLHACHHGDTINSR